MAIAGLIVHTLPDCLEPVGAALETMPGLTVYGSHDGQYVMAVAEFPAADMEKEVARAEAIDGVLTIYTTYLTVEDELAEA